ncbi:MAG: RDD family protein [Vulcanimicrobiaceae bacterium]
MDRSVEVATGESVAFSYELAGLGSRFLALAIDLAIQASVVVVGLAVLAALGWALHGTLPARAVAPAAAKLASALAIAVVSFAAFALFFGYFIFFEWRDGGRTPGKRLVGIRVVRDGGFPLDLTSAVVRNVVRILEFLVGFYAVSALATLASPANRRLGDMAAGTIVIRDRRYERTAAAALVARGTARRDDDVVAALGHDERELVRRYGVRRAGLSERARATVARAIAASVRPKLAIPFAHLGDDDLLVHLATTALADER